MRLTLGSIADALECALPALPHDPAARSAIATATALRLGHRDLLALPASMGARVTASATTRDELALQPLASVASPTGAESLALFTTTGLRAAASLDSVPPISPGVKLVLRGFPSDLLRVDNDDGTLRWRSLTLTARALSPTALKLDEPDAIATFAGLLGAPVFALQPTGLAFAGVLSAGEKRSVQGLGEFAPAADLLRAAGLA